MAHFSDRFIDKLYDAEYDVFSDFKELNKKRICDNCGCEYTIDEAASFFSDHINGITYLVLSGLCGPCAVEAEEATRVRDYDD